MEFMLVVFRVRTQTLTFANLLRSYKVQCSIINTPRVINVSCGISVSFSPKDMQTVQDLLSRRNFDSFAGLFKLKKIGNQIVLS